MPRRFQFSLRDLLWLMVTVSAFFAGAGWYRWHGYWYVDDMLMAAHDHEVSQRVMIQRFIRLLELHGIDASEVDGVEPPSDLVVRPMQSDAEKIRLRDGTVWRRSVEEE